MTEPTVDILLVEDNPNDVELMLHALKANNLSNRVEIVRDGEEALEFLFGSGAHSSRRARRGQDYDGDFTGCRSTSRHLRRSRTHYDDAS